MPMGPGKYDDVATIAGVMSGASCVIVAVIDGNQGTGFSVQSTSKEIVEELPALLRLMADEIETSMKEQA